jgi:hypothetical protein
VFNTTVGASSSTSAPHIKPEEPPVAPVVVVAPANRPAETSPETDWIDTTDSGSLDDEENDSHLATSTGEDDQENTQNKKRSMRLSFDSKRDARSRDSEWKPRPDRSADSSSDESIDYEHLPRVNTPSSHRGGHSSAAGTSPGRTRDCSSGGFPDSDNTMYTNTASVARPCSGRGRIPFNYSSCVTGTCPATSTGKTERSRVLWKTRNGLDWRLEEDCVQRTMAI